MTNQQTSTRPAPTAPNNRPPPPQAAPLAPVDQTPAPERRAEDLVKAGFTISTVVQSESGYEFEIAGTVDQKDIGAFIALMDKGLLGRNLKPVERNPPAVINMPEIHVEGGGGVPAAQGSGEAVEIPGENGGPPRCSVHGPMVWKENKADGSPLNKWVCKSFGCRPKKRS